MSERIPQGRIPELDGLRGIAIFLVLLAHYISQYRTGDTGTLLGKVQRFFSLGWSGVDLFFVLSGFLIDGILMDAANRRVTFRPSMRAASGASSLSIISGLPRG